MIEAYKEIRDTYLGKNPIENKDVNLYALATSINKWLNFTNTKIGLHEFNKLLGLICQVAQKNKNTSKILEEELLRSIWYYTHNHSNLATNTFQNLPGLNKGLIKTEKGDKIKKIHEISLHIETLALKLNNVNKERDSFNGTRKGYSIRLLGELSRAYKIEGIEELYTTGVLYYQLDTDLYTATKKMIII